jgi:hypothetical protein
MSSNRDKSPVRHRRKERRKQSRSKGRRERSRSRSREKKYEQYRNNDPTIVTDPSRAGWLRHIHNNKDQLKHLIDDEKRITMKHEITGLSTRTYNLYSIDIDNLSRIYTTLVEKKFLTSYLCDFCQYGVGDICWPLCLGCRYTLFTKNCPYKFKGCKKYGIMNRLTYSSYISCYPCKDYL